MTSLSIDVRSAGKHIDFTDSKMHFRKYCSHLCEQKDPTIKQSRIDTCFKRYGNLNNIKKQQETMLKKYGVKSALSKSELREKGKQTKFQRYRH